MMTQSSARDSPTLSILMAALSPRPWEALRDELLSQIAAIGSQNEVELLVVADCGQRKSGDKRQQLLESARGRYCCYVDDDDAVSPLYVQSLLEGCNSGTDVITHKLEFSRSDRPQKNEIWAFGLWPNDRERGQMQVNHLCAWKTDIARQVAWCPDLGTCDDHLWFEPLFAAGLVKTEAHIDDVLYFYHFDAAVTVNQRLDRIQHARYYFGAGLRCFFRAGTSEILIECGVLDHLIAPNGSVFVRDLANRVSLWPLTELEEFHTVRTF